jgi:hypothetical protein
VYLIRESTSTGKIREARSAHHLPVELLMLTRISSGEGHLTESFQASALFSAVTGTLQLYHLPFLFSLMTPKTPPIPRKVVEDRPSIASVTEQNIRAFLCNDEWTALKLRNA